MTAEKLERQERAVGRLLAVKQRMEASGAYVPIVPRRRDYPHFWTETYALPDGTVRATHCYSKASGRFALCYDTGDYVETAGAEPSWRRYTQVLLYEDRGEAARPVLRTEFPDPAAGVAFGRAWVNDGK